MKRFRLATQQGFTLLELMMTLSLSSILLAAIYATFHSQQETYLSQTRVAELQQSSRAGIYLLARELRMAGYNPTFAQINPAGFVTTFPAPNNIFTINYAYDTNIIAFTSDALGPGNGVINQDNAERIAYRFNNTKKALERLDVTSTSEDPWEVIVPNVDALNFLYFDADGVRTFNPANFRFVEVSLLVRTEKPDFSYVNTTVYKNSLGHYLCPTCTGDHYHRLLLNTKIQIRNL